MDSRGPSPALYFVICPRCETVSRIDEPACPYCGADRHGAVLTRGMAGAVRAIEAAGAPGQADERRSVESFVSLPPFESDAPLPAPLPAPLVTRHARIVKMLGAPTESAPRLSPVAMASVIIAVVAMCMFFWRHTTVEPETSGARSAGVSVAGAIRKADPPTQKSKPKATLPPPPSSPPSPPPSPSPGDAAAVQDAQARFVAMALPTSTAVFDARPVQVAMTSPGSPWSPWSPWSFDCCAVPRDADAHPIAFSSDAPADSGAPVATKRDTHRKPATTMHARAKQKAPASAGACAQKNHKACVEQAAPRTVRHGSRPVQKRPQTRPARRASGTAQTKPAPPTQFQKVGAVPAPVKPAMTSEGSWKPSGRAN